MKSIFLIILMFVSSFIFSDNWKNIKVLDCFGDATGEEYITNVLPMHGTYNRSEELQIDIVFKSTDDVVIKLYRYGNQLVSQDYITPLVYDIKIKDCNGEIFDFIGLGKIDGVHVADSTLFYRMLDGDCRIFMKSNKVTTYLFKVLAFDKEGV